MLDGKAMQVDSDGVKWCSHGGHFAPFSHFAPDGASRQTHCRHCRVHYVAEWRNKNGIPQPIPELLEGVARDADNEARYRRWLAKQGPDRKIAKELGFRRKDVAQLDLVIECTKAGVSPGSGSRQAQTAPDVAELIASRQAAYEAQRPRPSSPDSGNAALQAGNVWQSRQQRRHAQRRMVKDALQEMRRRTLDPHEVVTLAIDRAISARDRASGGPRTRTVMHRRVRWNLPPSVAAEIIGKQGYRCALTGWPFEESKGYGTSQPYSPSPNRINPGGDYTADNCEFVLWFVNRMIGDMPRPAALELLTRMKILRRYFGQEQLPI